MPPIAPPTKDVLQKWFGPAGVPRERGVADGSSPNESFEVDHNTATRVFRCDWLSRFSAIQWMLGYSQVYSDSSGSQQLSRLPPQKHPFFDTWYATKVTKVSGYKWLSWDSTNNVNVFKEAEIEVLYEQVPYYVLSDEQSLSELDRYIEYPAQPPEPGGEYLSLPGVGFKYTADPAGPDAGSNIDNRLITANVGKVVPQMVFTVGWHRLPFSLWAPSSLLWQRLFGTGDDKYPYFGATNKSEFKGFKPGTLLLTNVKPFRRSSPTGVGWELDLFFELTYVPRPYGWNAAYGTEVGSANPQHDGWYQVTNDHVFRPPGSMPDGKSIYVERAIEDLFALS